MILYVVTSECCEAESLARDSGYAVTLLCWLKRARRYMTDAWYWLYLTVLPWF